MSSYKDQLEQWVKGNSLHDHVLGQCCPDFSCCNGRPGWDIPTRERFNKAILENDHTTKNEMLGMALASLISNEAPSKKVYIAGQENINGTVN